ncbi:winged helix-turn-helix transcriptional regulator [Aminipila butyrica]|uniref:Winged helix-turn-helix transcriptional regulator n=1 Tax=Aminipila butyrica TaxID=433296 RepID=A0A858BS80_9FIRM|nr:MarR family winged helix-turn-helix transcriptional regulator [Aminipila butyrica]QIB68821.1 winged helix-turn-helix transcriptional regulator [Aminipila butyrica]
MNKQQQRKTSSPCNCLNIRRASHTLTEVYDEFLDPCGLTVSQFSLLRHVNFLGPISVSALSNVMRLDRTTLVRNLKPLEKIGLVEDRSTEGSRNRQLALSPKGQKACGQAEVLWQKAQCFTEEYLGKENLQLFTELLIKIESLRP